MLGATLVLAASVIVAAAAPNTTRYAFIARGDNPIDALAAAPIAGRLNAPVLLTPATTLSDATRQGLLDRDPDVVIIAGGTAAVSDDVKAAIESLLPDAQVLRVAGTSRYTTAQELAALVATIEPAFATTEGNDTNAFGIACPDGHTLTAITDTGQPDCAPDNADGGDAATLDGMSSTQLRAGIDAATLDGRTAGELANYLERWCELVATHPASYPAAPCQASPFVTVLDDVSGIGGTAASIAIGTDSLPIVVYRAVGTDLKVVHCTNAACTTHATPQTLDDVSFAGYTSITVGTDGMPIIAYHDGSLNDLKLVHCTTITCETSDSPQDLDSADVVGRYTSIAIGTDGFPIISYYDDTNDDLKAVHCTNVACTSHETPQTLDATGNVGQYTSLAIGTDGMPVITYYDATNDDLKVVHCTNPACTSTDSPATVDSSGDVGTYTAIAIGVDGRPVVTYTHVTNEKLKVAQLR